MDVDRFIAGRALRVKESGIRRIFHLAASLKNPVNFSIGQPDYGVPEPVKRAAIQAIEQGHNGYTVTQGLPELREKIAARLSRYYSEPPGILISSGVSGGLLLALMATVNPGDEVIFPDPYFVSYANLVEWLDGQSVPVFTYPDFQLSPERIASAITPKTKLLLINSPNNPTGVVYGDEEIKALCELADKHDLLILSDEIYCDLSYDGRAISPIQFAPHRTILLGGFSKSYGMTGWRMGYVAGPPKLIDQMSNMQQYTFVCAPSMAQHASLVALETDVSQNVDRYRQKCERVAAELKDHFEFTKPSGGFYFFPKVPDRYDNSTAFVEAAIDKNLLLVPGGVFSQRDTHFRLSYATNDDDITRGCEILRSMI